MKIDRKLKAEDLRKPLDRFFSLAAAKAERLNKSWNPAKGSPVFTVKGRYTTRGWTEWTQGFQFGIQVLLFDATGDRKLLDMGIANTDRYMAPHVSHIGVHDHGFNNVSTYGNLRRLLLEGKSGEGADRLAYYDMALKVSGAVQAARWTTIADGTGFIHSFNGPHSLFSDTIRSCRALVAAHHLGHCLMGEGDRKFSLLQRAIEHMNNTFKYNVYFGEGRDAYDVRGRVVHESIFNCKDGAYRCPSTQQGYSPFSTWTRGLSWVIAGAAEELEFFEAHGGKAHEAFKRDLLRTAKATCDFFIENAAADGIPYWDTGAPGLAKMPNHLKVKSRPDNPYEPVDSSAAAISAQGLLRLGRYLGIRTAEGRKYWQAGLTVARTLLAAPYLSTNPKHEGLILHSIYHRPNDWDYTPPGKKIPQGESSMWGDYHAVELAVYLHRVLNGEPYPTFFA
ncbi:MAG: unsaturated chondroitin disaccharide hydrolase [Candidatus Sumerlaeota bacterium]|nr:unsaturated chondroitin disaccharide hydrolase [Candidatus Sumerlaeota bacterium]